MDSKEKEKVVEVIHLLFDLNNKALFLAKGECPGINKVKQLLTQISEQGYQCFNILNDLVRNSKPEIMTVDEFVHKPLMGG